jgi:hypothetical protein
MATLVQMKRAESKYASEEDQGPSQKNSEVESEDPQVLARI